MRWQMRLTTAGGGATLPNEKIGVHFVPERHCVVSSSQLITVAGGVRAEAAEAIMEPPSRRGCLSKWERAHPARCMEKSLGNCFGTHIYALRGPHACVCVRAAASLGSKRAPRNSRPESLMCLEEKMTRKHQTRTIDRMAREAVKARKIATQSCELAGGD